MLCRILEISAIFLPLTVQYLTEAAPSVLAFMYTERETFVFETLNKVSRDIFDYSSLIGVVGSDKNAWPFAIFGGSRDVVTTC